MTETPMRYKTGEFAGGGLQLVWQSWSPTGPATAVLAVVHGFGEHGGRYAFLVDDMVPRGYAVFTFDLRGFGRSPGRRGHVDRFNDYVTDTGAFLTEVRRQCPGTPVILLGHSMGGLVVAAFAERNEAGLAGVVLSSPFLGGPLSVPAFKRKAAWLLSRVTPTYRMDNELHTDQISHDPAVLAAAAADPLNHLQTTARLVAEIPKTQAAVLAAAGQLRSPLLLLYAGRDSLVDPRASETFFGRAASVDKAKHCYADYYHEIFNEVGRASVFEDLAAWLATHVSPAQTT